MKWLKKLLTVVAGYVALLSIGFLVVYIIFLLTLSKLLNHSLIFVLSILVSSIFILTTSTVKIDPDY